MQLQVWQCCMESMWMFKLVIVFDNKKNKMNLSGLDFPDYDTYMRHYSTEVLFNVMLESIF